MEQIRSFIAIELPDGLKQELSQLEAQLQSGKVSGVRWVDPNSIHLTLKFLGNIAIARTSEITGVMAEAARGIPPFHIQIKDLGAFPNLRRVQIVWVGISGEVNKLAELQQRIESNLARLGFAPEARAFTPHLTLARVGNRTSPDERQRLGQLIANTRFEANSRINVDRLSLMKSQLTREGAIYSQTSLVELNKSHSPGED